MTRISFQNSQPPSADEREAEQRPPATFDATSSDSDATTIVSAEQRLEAEHGPVAPLPHAPGGESMTRRTSSAAAREPGRGPSRRRRARRGSTTREQRRDRGRDRERGAAARRARAARGPRGRLVALLGARVAAAHAIGAGRGGPERGGAARPAPAARPSGPRGARGTPGAPSRLAATPRHVGSTARRQRGAQAARRRLGVVRLGDRAHDDDARARPRRRRPRPSPASIPPIANHGTARRAPAAWRTSSRPTAGRPGFVGVAWTGPDGDVVGAARRAGVDLRGRCVDSPTIASSPTAARASRDRHVVLADVDAVGAGPRARSGRSLTMNSAPAARQRAARPRGRGEDLRVGRRLSRSWTMSTPPRSARVERARRPPARSQTKYRRASARRARRRPCCHPQSARPPR